MSREIKFRVLDIDNKCWSSAEVFIGDGYASLGRYEWAIIQRFTGLKDIHGNEIYEGDIITYIEKTHEHGDSTQQRGQVIYDEAKASFAIAGEKTGEVWNYFTDYGLSKFEVVGNVFEGVK